MIDTLFYMMDSVLFFCVGISAIYLFIFAVAALLRRPVKYPKAEKYHRCVLLVPPQTSICKQEYPEALYTILPFDDLFQTVREIDTERYDIAIILGETSYVSSLLLQEVNDAYNAGAIAIQLHHVTECPLTGKIRWQAIKEEVRNSIFRQGHTQVGISSAFDKRDIAVDAKWLKQNMKSPKSNLESRLLRQNIYIEYLNYIHVYSHSPRPCPQPMSRWKTLSKLPATLLEGNLSYADKLFRQLLPSWSTLLWGICIWCLFITYYDWSLSLGWWFLLFGLSLTICLAIPDYLVEKKKK